MAARPLSHHPILFWLGIAAGAIALGFGVNALIRPAHAMSFFEIDPPTSPDGRDLFDLIVPVYGIRNVHLGLTILIAAYLRAHKMMGWGIFGFAACAVVDGVVCWRRGLGQGTHWGYAPQLFILGGLLMGVLDGKNGPKGEKKA